jgi:hypothetical protein
VKELESRCAVLDAQVADLSSEKVELCSRMAAENGAAQEARCDATALEVCHPLDGPEPKASEVLCSLVRMSV